MYIYVLLWISWTSYDLRRFMISGAGTDFEIRRWDALLHCLYRSVVGTLGETIGRCFEKVGCISVGS